MHLLRGAPPPSPPRPSQRLPAHAQVLLRRKCQSHQFAGNALESCCCCCCCCWCCCCHWGCCCCCCGRCCCCCCWICYCCCCRCCCSCRTNCPRTFEIKLKARKRLKQAGFLLRKNQSRMEKSVSSGQSHASLHAAAIKAAATATAVAATDDGSNCSMQFLLAMNNEANAMRQLPSAHCTHTYPSHPCPRAVPPPAAAAFCMHLSI